MKDLLAKVDTIAAAQGISCGSMADELLELGMRAWLAQEKRARSRTVAAVPTTSAVQEQLMAI